MAILNFGVAQDIFVSINLLLVAFKIVQFITQYSTSHIGYFICTTIDIQFNQNNNHSI